MGPLRLRWLLPGLVAIRLLHDGPMLPYARTIGTKILFGRHSIGCDGWSRQRCGPVQHARFLPRSRGPMSAVDVSSLVVLACKPDHGSILDREDATL